VEHDHVGGKLANFDLASPPAASDQTAYRTVGKRKDFSARRS
jgi:hypothetical protein